MNSDQDLNFRVALVGNPNCGKTALFNSLTGGKQKVGNYPGVTVERKEGFARWEDPSGGPQAPKRKMKILDLPGLYSLAPKTPDERISQEVILGAHPSEARPDGVIAVVDAANLERGLALVLEIQALGMPMVLALNMMDLAQARGLVLDLEMLEESLGIPVIPTVAVRGEGLTKLLSRMRELLITQKNSEQVRSLGMPGIQSSEKDVIEERFVKIDQLLARVVKKQLDPSLGTEKIDRLVLHPILGPLFFGLVLLLLFQALFTWAAIPQDWIKAGIELAKSAVQDWIPNGALQSLLVDGVLGGVGAVLVFLPQILLLFFFILLLEDSGYMARAAFLIDRLMAKVGLNGRAFIPLLSSYACAIPGIMATRTIENRRDRLVTIMVAPLTTCSARLPVYTLLIGAFIPNRPVLPFLGLQAVVMIGLYAAGIITALLVAVLLRKSLFRGHSSTLLMELPTYKWPSFKNVGLGLWDRAKTFVQKAGTVILSLMIGLWFLATYPKLPEGAPKDRPAIEYSLAGRFGKWIEPVLKPLGMDWRIGVALVPGFAAREVMVGALATVYAVEARGAVDHLSADPSAAGLAPSPSAPPAAAVSSEEGGTDALAQRLAKEWSLATALSLLVWYVFACQCLSTLAVVKRETHSWKWPALMMGYMTALAYLASFVTFRLTQFL
jgi:ferrous iron transport protein B